MVTQLLYSNLEKNKDSVALVHKKRQLSYSELCELVDFFSSYLFSIGVRKGDVVSIYLPNSVEFVVSFFSVANLGAISVPINNSYKALEVSNYILYSKTKFLITNSFLKKEIEKFDNSYFTTIVISDEFAEWSVDKSRSFPNYEIDINLEDKAIYLFSTGSTGKPKCVARNHYNLLALAENHTATVGWTKEDKVLFVVPVSHTYGFGNFISSIKVGATIYLLEEFNRKRVIDLIEQERISVFPAVPFMLEILSRTRLVNRRDFSSLKIVISAGAPLSEEIFYDFYKKFCTYPRQLYGSSETGVISINLASDIKNKNKSVGRPVRNVEVRIEKEDGSFADVSEVGEILVRSPSMTTRYENQLEETEKSFKNGYYYTGDLGKIDADGYIYIVGRKKLFINISGQKVDPVEVENLLLSHNEISEVAVVGSVEKNGKEIIRAFIVVNNELTSKDIINFCKGKISDIKIPKVIEFRDSLPKSSTGKILRDKLN